jgi:peptidoglycan/LPS O-acetylase OafA/YrhL
MSEIGLLENRRALLTAAAICLVLAVLTKTRPQGRLVLSQDWPVIPGLAFSLLVSAAIALRSPLRIDRRVFSLATTAFGLALAGLIIPSPTSLGIISVLKGLLWLCAAAICVLHAVRKNGPNTETNAQ